MEGGLAAGCFGEAASHSLHSHEPNLVFVCLHQGKGQLSECEPQRSHAKAFLCPSYACQLVHTSYCLDSVRSTC